MSPRRPQYASLNAMFQLNSWIPRLSDSSKLAVRNSKIPTTHIQGGCGPYSHPERTPGVRQIHFLFLSRSPASAIQPLEPMLLPKLRICFADFPWSHFSMDQRLFTSESGCGYRYGPSMRDCDLRQIFHENSQGSERR